MNLIVDIYLVRRQGWVLPRFRACMYRPSRGILLVRDQHIVEMRRHIRVATLQPTPDSAEPAPPPLHDVQLVWSDGHELMLNGFERIEESPGRWIDYAQSWDALVVRAE